MRVNAALRAKSSAANKSSYSSSEMNVATSIAVCFVSRLPYFKTGRNLFYTQRVIWSFAPSMPSIFVLG
jgi:hypothetical protein